MKIIIFTEIFLYETKINTNLAMPLFINNINLYRLHNY